VRILLVDQALLAVIILRALFCFARVNRLRKIWIQSRWRWLTAAGEESLRLMGNRPPPLSSVFSGS
jgi:hypothetical protein